MTRWAPAESEKDAAVGLLADLLRVPEDEQLGVLVILVNLWCYHQNVKTGRMQLCEAGGSLFYPDSPEDEREFQRCIENAQDREAVPSPEKCADPDCDGLAGHAGPHYQWVPE